MVLKFPNSLSVGSKKGQKVGWLSIPKKRVRYTLFFLNTNLQVCKELIRFIESDALLEPCAIEALYEHFPQAIQIEGAKFSNFLPLVQNVRHLVFNLLVDGSNPVLDFFFFF